MKETIDYEKKYNDLVARLNKAKNDEDVCDDRFCVVIDEILLEPNETEDEKVRKALLRCCDDWDKGQFGCMKKEDVASIRAYLEKRKEPVVNGKGLYYYDGEIFTYLGYIATEENPHYFAMGQQEKQKEQKPILEVFGFKVGDAVRLKDGDGRKHIIKSFKEVKGLNGPNFYHVEFEDNSARDGIYPGKQYLKGYYTQMEKFEEEQIEELSTRLNGLMQEYVKSGKDEEEQEHRLKCYQLFWDALGDSEFFKKKEQKPVILGPDETEFPYNHPANTLEGEIKNIWSKLSRENAFVASFEGFREVILHFVNFIQKDQKPAEWSNEDSDMICEIIDHCITIPYIGGTLRLSDERKKELKTFVKSLRPQPKAELTLLDENIITAAIAFVEQNDHFNCWGGIDKHTVIKALRSLKPHWKPSEEQMEILQYVCEESSHPNPDVIPTLQSLYNDLKKLM